MIVMVCEMSNITAYLSLSMLIHQDRLCLCYKNVAHHEDQTVATVCKTRLFAINLYIICIKKKTTGEGYLIMRSSLFHLNNSCYVMDP